MVLESTMICFDNSEFTRNGDFIPNRLQAEIDAVDLLAQCKLKSHPENNVGLLTMASDRVDVLSTLTAERNCALMKLHQIQSKGPQIHFLTGIKIAHLALKHRQGRNHKQRIVAFVGSPILDDTVEIVKTAKKLKKEKVSVDVVSFGEEEENNEKLAAFIDALNGKDGTSSRLVSVPAGSHMQQILASSVIIRSEDGTGPAITATPGGGFEFGIDPNEDPELAMALRISMEEQRVRQEEEARRQAATVAEATAPIETVSAEPNLDAMTEEEQIAFALRMSMQEGQMEVEDAEASASGGGNLGDLAADPAALQDILASLPGFDAGSKEGQAAMANISKPNASEEDKKDDKPAKK